jgi:hypothetical protein
MVMPGVTLAPSPVVMCLHPGYGCQLLSLLARREAYPSHVRSVASRSLRSSLHPCYYSLGVAGMTAGRIPPNMFPMSHKELPCTACLRDLLHPPTRVFRPSLVAQHHCTITTTCRANSCSPSRPTCLASHGELHTLYASCARDTSLTNSS